MAGQTGLPGGDGLHIAELAINNGLLMHAGQWLTCCRAVGKKLQNLLFPDIWLIAGIAHAQGGARHLPGCRAMCCGQRRSLNLAAGHSLQGTTLLHGLLHALLQGLLQGRDQAPGFFTQGADVSRLNAQGQAEAQRSAGLLRILITPLR